ncbi:hypothetical protein AMTRI_Chr05g74320 [Amborella trichopoda]
MTFKALLFKIQNPSLHAMAVLVHKVRNRHSFSDYSHIHVVRIMDRRIDYNSGLFRIMDTRIDYNSGLFCHFYNFHSSNSRPFSSLSDSEFSVSSSQLSDNVNEICRILSDYRSPNHDMEPSLERFNGELTTDLVEQVLKRCKDLGNSSHRFFIWAYKRPDFKHSEQSYRILVDILGSNRHFPMIWDLVFGMKNDGFEIKRELFWVMFRSYARANLPTDAIRAFRRMEEFGIKPSIDDLDQLIYTLCKHRLVDYAHKFFEKAKFEFAVSSKSYSILINGWGEIGNWVEAESLFHEMVKEKVPLDIVAYNTLLGSLCKSGKVDYAHKLFREMGSYGLVPDAFSYSTFVNAYSEADDVNSAIRVFDSMRRHNLVPNVYTYNSLIKVLCKNERVDDAYGLLDEMIEKGLSPDLWSYNTILAIHCNVREVNKALRLLNRMDRDLCKPDKHTYNMLLKMLILVGRFDRAVEVWNGMEERGFYPAVTTYAVMIHGLCKRGRIEDACSHFETMIDEGVPPYTSTCELIRNHLVHLGMQDKARVIANKMQRASSCSIQELSIMFDLPLPVKAIETRSKKGVKVCLGSKRKRETLIKKAGVGEGN